MTVMDDYSNQYPSSWASLSQIKLKEESSAIGKERHYHVCGGGGGNQTKKKKFGPAWKILCEGELLVASEILLQEGHHVHLVQIGAHVGFEYNDPFARGIISYLNTLLPSTKQRFHWHFVEPSPPNYQRLMKNLANHSDLCDMRGIHKAVVPDSYNITQKEALTFYSISPDIDPETGYDRRTGKKLPPFVTQISSFSMDPLKFNKNVFKRKRLKMKDYIVKTKVPSSSYSELIQEIMTGNYTANSTESTSAPVASWFTSSMSTTLSGSTKPQKPLFVLIDTEGFDCKILCGISKTSPFWPPFLIYEHTQCSGPMKKKTMKRLADLGYQLHKLPKAQNTVAIRNSSYSIY